MTGAAGGDDNGGIDGTGGDHDRGIDGGGTDGHGEQSASDGVANGGRRGARDEPISLDLVRSRSLRRRALSVAIGAVIVAAAFGGIVGFFAGRMIGLIVAVVVAVPLLLLALTEGRRKAWLSGGVIAVRTLRTRRVELRHAERLDLLITKVRGRTTVSMLVGGPPKGHRVTVALAVYICDGGAELGILALRRLADALAAAEDTRALVFSQLLVAALRAEARGDSAGERPLNRIASLAPDGHWGQRVRQESLSAFVASLD